MGRHFQHRAPPPKWGAARDLSHSITTLVEQKYDNLKAMPQLEITCEAFWARN